MNNSNTVLKFDNDNPDLNYFINAGFFVINPEALKYVTSMNTFWENQPIFKIIQNKNLHCYIHNGFWKNLDTYKDSLILNKIWKKNKKKW
jgi:glucose-1-phosphate cytidylyltransferase